MLTRKAAGPHRARAMPNGGRKRIAMGILLGYAAFLSACVDLYLVPSLHPLYREKDLVFEPALLGTWAAEKKSPETMTFSKKGAKSYRFVYADEDGKTSEFLVHLARIEGKTVMDIFPLETGDKKTAFPETLFLPVHTFLLVRQMDPTLILSPFVNSRWLTDTLKTTPAALRHERVREKYIVITAPPEEMQTFLSNHLENVFLEGEDGGWTRIRDAR